MLIVLVLYRAVPSKQDRYSVEKCATSSIWRDGLQHEGEPTFDRGNAHKKHTNRHKTAVRKCPHSQKCTQHLLTSYLKVIRSDLFATFVFVGWQHTFPLCVGFVVSLFEQQVAAEYRVPWCSGRHCIKLFMAMSKIQKGAPLTRENSNIRACELNLRHLTTTHSSRFIISTLFSACSFLKSVFCI